MMIWPASREATARALTFCAVWRRSLVGEELLDLLDGKIRLSLDGAELNVERREA